MDDDHPANQPIYLPTYRTLKTGLRRQPKEDVAPPIVTGVSRVVTLLIIRVRAGGTLEG